MSLAEIYREHFGDTEKTAEEAPVENNAEAPAENEEGVMTKEAADAAFEEAFEALTEEEAEKLAQVVEVMDEEGLEFDHDLQKLAAAAEIVDEYEEYVEAEKTAAEEIDAGGRLFARAIVDELAKIEEENK